MKNSWKIMLGFLFSLSLLSCGKTDGLAPGYADITYGGAGSAYEVNLRADGSFTITKKATVTSTDADFVVNGTYERFSTGFIKLTVSSVTGTGGPSSGDTAYALEVPGFALLLKPTGGEAEVIPMVALGECPTADMTLNWISLDEQGGNAATGDTFGTFQYTASTGTAVLPLKKRLSDYGTVGTNQSIGSATCSGGIMSVDSATMWLTPSGAVVGTDNGAIIAFEQSDSVTIAGLAGTYSGIVFNEAAGSGNKNFPVKMTLAESGAGTGTRLADVETGELTSDTVTFNLSSANVDANGLVRASVAGSNNAICAAAPAVAGSTRRAIFCAGLMGTSLFSMVMVSQ